MIKLLDLFCGGGGCSVGYAHAGVQLGIRKDMEICGVDNRKQKGYPFDFIEDDAMKFLDLDRLRFMGITHIHASPPCQLFSRSTVKNRSKHVDLLTPVLEFLRNCPIPSVTENVMPAPLRGDIILNGQMFGLKVIRERKFEINGWFAMNPGKAQIKKNLVVDGKLITVTSKGIYNKNPLHRFDRLPGRTPLEKQMFAMGIDWMSQKQLGQAIPPAYTSYIGLQWFKI